MGQNCCRQICWCKLCGGPAFCTCLMKETLEPKYARYQSASEEEIDLENIVGEPLELDPLVIDSKTGEQRIYKWTVQIAPELDLPETELDIDRLKCVKYWDSVIEKDVSKLNGSTVKFCFERKSPEDIPRLVIEHKGKSMFIRNASKRASKNQPTYARPLVQQPSSDKEMET